MIAGVSVAKVCMELEVHALSLGGSERCPSWSGKNKAHKLKKNPLDTGRVSMKHPAGHAGVYRPVSQGFPVVRRN